MYTYNKNSHKSSGFCECENRSLLRMDPSAVERGNLTRVQPARGGQSSEMAAGRASGWECAVKTGRLRYALNEPHKPRRRASLRRTPPGQQQIKRKGTFLKKFDRLVRPR